MKLVKSILFWIFFPIIALLISGLLIFYLDLANGPLVIFILEIIALVVTISLRIILRKKRLLIRLIPLAALILVNAILLPLAKPIAESKSIAYYSHPEKTEVMQLNKGKVVGYLNKDKSVRMYAGIPYAKAPIGDLRWKEPVEEDSWDDVRDCTHFASISMQPASNPLIDNVAHIYAAKAWHPNFIMEPDEKRSEDSLYLNIWRPNNNQTNLPILVFIHGGSLTSGSSSNEDYNGEAMAKKGVIMITITYRLGVFGYFAHQDLINESSNHTTGNYGLLDQIRALQWINENASYFGGDKSNITIAGESAGSSSVSALCTSPLSKGLFTRAIGESSSLVLKRAPHTFRPLDYALNVGENIMKEFKCSSIEELRKVPASKLVTTKYSNSEMTLDGYALTKTPYESYLAKENHETALLNGYNVKEGDAFIIPMHLFNPANKHNILSKLEADFGKETAKQIYDLYKDRIQKDAFNVFNEIYSVYWFIYPHHSWSKMALETGIPVYRYQFLKENHWHGTYHAAELIYAYGNVKNCPYGYRYDNSDEILSEKMLSYWSNFAKTGNPNEDNLETWNEYTYGGKVMGLDATVGPIEDRYLGLYSIFDNFTAHYDELISK